MFAFNYGGRAEVVAAARAIARDIASGEIDPDSVTEAAVSERMYLPEMPDPDLVIRTSGEQRTSNYLLWQQAYSEYVFTPVLWPDFDRVTLAACIEEFAEPDHEQKTRQRQVRRD